MIFISQKKQMTCTKVWNKKLPDICQVPYTVGTKNNGRKKKINSQPISIKTSIDFKTLSLMLKIIAETLKKSNRSY